MKNILKYIALVCATVMLVGITACTKSETTDVSVDVNETDSITVAVDTSTTESEAKETTVSEETEPELPVTNEAGELTIDGATFETMYGSQLGNYLNHQYYYDDIAIPIAESNFYFIHEFIDLSNQAYRLGYYPLTSEGFVDLSYAFENGTIGTFSFDCFGDYFRESAESQIISTYIVLDFANEDGLELSEETEADIQHYMETLTEGASQYGLTLDEYLKIFYGPDCTRDVFVGILERYYLTTVYSDEYVANYGFTDDELYVPKVCHALFMSVDGASDEEDEIAREGAYGLLEECQTADDVLNLGNVLYTSGTVAECATYEVQRDVFVPEFEDWAYEESRQVDDIDVVKTYYGYHVIGYMGLVELSDDAKTEIALKALNDEIGAIAFNNVHDFYTPDEVITPDPVDPNANKQEADEETVPTLNYDESGNLVVETTTTTTTTESVIIAVPEETTADNELDSANASRTVGVVAIIVGVIALVAAACFGVASVVKGKKIEIDDQDEKKESSDSEEDDASEE